MSAPTSIARGHTSDPSARKRRWRTPPDLVVLTPDLLPGSGTTHAMGVTMPVTTGERANAHPAGNQQPDHPGGSRMPVTCAACGVEFIPNRGNVAKGMGRFCSRGCAGRARRKPGWVPTVLSVARTCTSCGSTACGYTRRGLCDRCYRALVRAGGVPPRRVRTTAERFWSKVDKSGAPNQILGTPCWRWRGRMTPGGYGCFTLRHGVPRVAHRVAWMLSVGEIPDGAYLCHHCDNPPCVNPGHLFIGDAKANYDDMVAKGRRRAVGGGTVPRLNDAAALSASARVASGETVTAVAASLGVSWPTVKRAIRRADHSARPAARDGS